MLAAEFLYRSADVMSLKNALTSEELGLLDKMESELFSVKARDAPPDHLFHYTTPEAFHGIVKSGEIWATHFRYLNDPREVVHGEDAVYEVAKSLLAAPQETPVRAFLETFIDNFQEMRLTSMAGIYVASFSEHGDQLSQWRAYGDARSSYAVGFSRLPDPTADSDEALAGMNLYRCTYESESFRSYAHGLLLEMAKGFNKYVTAHAKREEGARALLATALGICWRRLIVEIFRLKDPGFREEGEWRLVVVPARERPGDLVKFRFTSGGMVPYIPIKLADRAIGEKLPIGRVTVGPGDNALLAKQAVEMFLDFEGYEASKIVHASEIPFRNVR